MYKVVFKVMLPFFSPVDSPSSSSSVGIFDPRSRALVLNSMPGILQFYMPQDDRHAFSVRRNFSMVAHKRYSSVSISSY